jgi:hypothetical protein
VPAIRFPPRVWNNNGGRARDALERWYDFESKSIERAMREWCEINEIEVTN